MTKNFFFTKFKYGIKTTQKFMLISKLLREMHKICCPASQVKKTEVRRDCSFAPIQLALCLRLATT